MDRVRRVSPDATKTERFAPTRGALAWLAAPFVLAGLGLASRLRSQSRVETIRLAEGGQPAGDEALRVRGEAAHQQPHMRVAV